MKKYQIYMDGDQWCAVNNEFIDLQESISGFGSNPLIALKILIHQENLGGKFLENNYFGENMIKRKKFKPSYEMKLFDKAVIAFVAAHVPNKVGIVELVEISRKFASVMMDARE